MMQLIYRGQSFHYVNAIVCPASRLPRAVNWRYQTPNYSTYSLPSEPLRDRFPRAVNWRFQAALEA